MQAHQSQPRPATPAFTVSLVSHRQGALASRCLADLAGLAPAGLTRVIVTRNLRDDPIVLPEHPPFEIVLLDNDGARGFGANHNAAFARCADPWFVVANPDIRLRADPFPALFAAAASRTGLVAPRVLDPDGREADSARSQIGPLQLVDRLARPRTRSAHPRPDWFAGMFLLIRSQAFRAIGGFDERFRMYCEDADLCARLRLAGWELAWAREALVEHDARRASRRSLRHAAWHLASLARMWSGGVWWRYRALLAAEREPRAGQALSR